MLLTVLSSVSIFAAVAMIFAAIARLSVQRGGAVALVLCWIIAACCATALMTWRVHEQQRQLGFTTAQLTENPAWQWFLPLWALGFGSICIRIWRRRRVVDASVAREAAASLPMFFAGILLVFTLILIYDVKDWL